MMVMAETRQSQALLLSQGRSWIVVTALSFTSVQLRVALCACELHILISILWRGKQRLRQETNFVQEEGLELSRVYWP
jgi:hypothetical protein